MIGAINAKLLLALQDRLPRNVNGESSLICYFPGTSVNLHLQRATGLAPRVSSTAGPPTV